MMRLRARLPSSRLSIKDKQRIAMMSSASACGFVGGITLTVFPTIKADSPK